MPIYKANDVYRANLRETWISSPADTSLQVTALPVNLPTIITVGFGGDTETVFTVTGTSGTDATNYALTGVTRLKGAEENIPEGTIVNCINHEEFFNQFIPYVDMTFEGDYDALTAYAEGSVVQYQGSSYVASAETTGNLPTDTDYWILIVEKGDRGSEWFTSGNPYSDYTDVPSPDERDIFLYQNSGDIFQYLSGSWSYLGTIKGDQGIQGVPGNDGLGVPAGGDAGQVLSKVSGADNDTEWSDPSGGGDFLVMQVFS